MGALKILALDTKIVTALQGGAEDDYGNLPERVEVEGKGNPCRHCLTDMNEGGEMLIFNHRPFTHLHAHTEQGPIFLHAESCARYDEKAGLPPMFVKRETFIVRAYDRDDRIVYGAGGVTKATDLPAQYQGVLNHKGVVYLHIRSGHYNCYQCRVELA